MINIKMMLSDFMDLVFAGKIEVYNEFSLQHELGIFLRERLHDFRVQFERNVSFFNISNTVKHEIDIVIYNETERYAIELKQPRNGQHPEQMFSFIKDIKFMEQLKEKGFNGTYCLTFVEDKLFYSSAIKTGIYSFFRGNAPIHGRIVKPTGSKDYVLDIMGEYKINWHLAGDKGAYYIVEL